MIFPGVSLGVLSVAGDLQMRNLLLWIFLFYHIFLSFSAFYGRILCIHCQMLCDLQINLSLVELFCKTK